MGPRRTVLMYAGDNFGLGHLRRCTRIASRLVREMPGTDAVLLTGLPLGCPFEIARGVDVIKLPSARKAAGGIYEPRTLGMDARRLIRVRTEIIRTVVRMLRPDLLLVDHLPVGVSGELLPVFEELEASTPVVLGLRDIIDDPETTRRRWHAQRVVAALNTHYDQVLIYGCPAVFDAVRSYGLDSDLRVPVRYCGYVGSDEAGEGTSGPGIARSPGQPRRVVITAGGGADGYPMMHACLAALRVANERVPVDPVFITGPYMPRENRELLEAEVRAFRGQVLWRVEAVSDLLETADLIICMGGYNTLLEAIRLGKRPLVIPRRGPSAEQRMRTRIFAERCLVREVEPESLTPEALARAILDSLSDETPRRTRLPDTDGLSSVVARLGILLERASARRRSPRPALVESAAGGTA